MQANTIQIDINQDRYKANTYRCTWNKYIDFKNPGLNKL